MLIKILRKLFFQALSIGLFLLIFIYSFFTAYGYKYDLKNFHLLKTSVIEVSTLEDHFFSRQETRVFLDGKLVGQSTPLTLREILPGAHQIVVRKAGFLPWKKKIIVKEDYVTSLPDLFLIPQKIRKNLLAREVRVVKIADRYLAILTEKDRLVIYDTDNRAAINLALTAVNSFFWHDQQLFIVAASGKYRYQPDRKLLQKLTTFVGFIDQRGQNFTTAQPLREFYLKNIGEIWRRQKAQNGEQAQEEQIVMRLFKPLEQVIGINQGKNFLYTTENLLALCDADAGNCFPLSAKDPRQKIYYRAAPRQIFYLLNHHLFQISFSDQPKTTFSWQESI